MSTTTANRATAADVDAGITRGRVSHHDDGTAVREHTFAGTGRFAPAPWDEGNPHRTLDGSVEVTTFALTDGEGGGSWSTVEVNVNPTGSASAHTYPHLDDEVVSLLIGADARVRMTRKQAEQTIEALTAALAR